MTTTLSSYTTLFRSKNKAGLDTRQLIGIADENQPRAFVKGGEERCKERVVDHRGLVDDHDIGGERTVSAVSEARVRRSIAVKPVERSGGGEVAGVVVIVDDKQG